MVFISILGIASEISILKQSTYELEYKGVSFWPVGKSILTKGYLNSASIPTGFDLWKSFFPSLTTAKSPEILKQDQKRQQKHNRDKHHEISTHRDLETRGVRGLKVLLSIFRPLTPARSGSELLPHPKAQVCIPYASAAPTKLPECPQCALQKHTASYTLPYSRGNRI